MIVIRNHAGLPCTTRRQAARRGRRAGGGEGGLSSSAANERRGQFEMRAAVWHSLQHSNPSLLTSRSVVGGTPPAAAPIGCCGANMTPTCTLEAVWEEEEEEEEDTKAARTRTGMEMGCPFLVAAREGGSVIKIRV